MARLLGISLARHGAFCCVVRRLMPRLASRVVLPLALQLHQLPVPVDVAYRGGREVVDAALKARAAHARLRLGL